MQQSKRPNSHIDTELLLQKRKQILRGRGRSSDNTINKLITQTSQQKYGIKSKHPQVLHRLQQRMKDRQVQQLRQKIMSLSFENQNLKVYIIELQSFIKNQIFNHTESNKKLDSSQYNNNLVFSFRMDNRDLCSRRQNISCDQNDKYVGLESTQICPNSIHNFHTQNTSLKNSANYNLNQSKNGYSLYTQQRTLLKIPEQPEKELKKARSQNDIKIDDQMSKKTSQRPQTISVRNSNKQIQHLRKKINKLEKMNSTLSKECSILKGVHKRKSSSNKNICYIRQQQEYEQIKVKVKKYEELIERQQKQMQKIIQLCEIDIQEKNRQICELTASYIEKKNKQENQISRLINHSQEIDFKLHHARQKINFLEEKNRKLNNTIDKLQRQLSQKDGNSCILQNKIRQLLVNNQTLTRQQDCLKGTILQMQKKISHQKSIPPKINNFIEDSSFSVDGEQRILTVNGKKFCSHNNIEFNTQL